MAGLGKAVKKEQNREGHDPKSCRIEVIETNPASAAEARIPFASLTTCHPEAAESSAKPKTPNEGSMQLAGSTGAADKSIGPSARKERKPPARSSCFRLFHGSSTGEWK
ncbi:MAG TPA: hypothetical protein VMD99_05755 [Terriglobales bacterium]|nr:hypothetical protein [Terriglobales bacterium]